MKTQHVSLLTLSLCLFIFFISSCKKDKYQPPVNYDTLAEDATIGDQVYSDMFRAVNNESGAVQNGSGKSADNCGVVTIIGNANEWPSSLSIDFGNGCTDDHGVVRKGKLTVTYNGPFFIAGSSLTVTSENYYVNGYTVDGALAIANVGRNSNGNIEFLVKVNHGSILKPNGTIVTSNSERTFEWSEGEHSLGLLGWCDNAWLVKGFSEGVTADGHDYRIDITTPLKKQSCCPWIVEGFISVMVDGSQSATIDYGDGECDHLASYTHDGATEQIIIH